MKSLINIYCLFVPILLAASCQESNEGNPDVDLPEQENTYINPVFSPVLADPTVVKSNGYFYAYGTEDNWGNEGGHKLVPIIRSKNLVNWEFVRNAFQVKPNWKNAGGIWAPDVTQVGEEYYMYYSYSTWGDPDAGIGLAIASGPEGPFIDQGKLFLSSEIGVENSIDPFYIEDDGKKFLFWGSFHGIYAIELSADGKSVEGEKVHIGHTHLEAAYVYKKDGAYFFFGSEGSCCEGANSTYQVRVGKSNNLLGPYLDKGGNSIADGNHGEIILRSNSVNYGFAGPGHNAEIMVDDEGTEWLLYHAIPKNNPRLDNGTNRRPLMLDKLIWRDGYPTIQGQEPSVTSQKAPAFND
ncbi:family 43 glycosylhydrolase [Anditalea andensis]|uniref:Arabinan endo-1,5-alpha-L-arabinosidase n=1 Tax=Anditalea andensis TaxID=1048983 RepID=A0A074KUG7_9BACT|nr:family 43 glycosylhydrolase [Anditalea andensis]KEO71925.1 arabinan endo-1,5-alpha-L-arabinosidase [Anditalea andensis]